MNSKGIIIIYSEKLSYVFMNKYLKLPVKFEPFFEKKGLNTCTLKESIARNLHLLITTSLGENKQDSEYGSMFWDFEYHIHMSNDSRRELIIHTLKKQIGNYEKRLTNVAVEVNVKQLEFRISSNVQMRKRIEIIISGRLAHSNDDFKFQTGFYIGPLLLD